MPPKKTKKSKSADGKKSDDLDGMPIALNDDKIKYLESHTQALEMQLVYRSELTSDAVSECETIREDLEEAKEKIEEEKRMTMDVMRAMTRQYKGMQDELLNKINHRERLIQTLKDELETLKEFHKGQIADKDHIIKLNNDHAAKYRGEIDNTLKKIANMFADARIELCSQMKSAASSG